MLAYELSNGGAYVGSLNSSHAAKATGANRHADRTSNRASPEELARVCSGSLDITTLRKSQPPSDAAVAAYIKRVGFDRIVNAIGPEAAFALFDKLTTPAAE